MLIYILSRSESLYSTQRIYQAGIRNKHNVRVIDHMECDLLIEDGEYKVVYEHHELIKPDYVIPRIGSSVTNYGCAVVRHFEQMGVAVVNKSEGIFNSRDKFRSLQLMSANNIRIPTTYFSYDLYYAERIAKQNIGYPLILKVLEGTQGEGVHLVRNEGEAIDLFGEFTKKNTRIILQEFISEFEGKDVRIIVVGDKIIATMMRIAQKGDFRSNIHRGGRGEIVNLSEQEKEMAIKTVQILGLCVAGVDILRSEKGPMVIEVNSSPGLEGIEGVTKIKIAEEIIKYIEKEHNK